MERRAYHTAKSCNNNSNHSVWLSCYWHLKIYMSANWQQILRVDDQHVLTTTSKLVSIDTILICAVFFCLVLLLSARVHRTQCPAIPIPAANINSFNMCYTIPFVPQLAHCSKCSPFPVCAVVFFPLLSTTGTVCRAKLCSCHSNHSDHRRPPTKSFRADSLTLSASLSISLFKSIEEVAIPAVDTASYRLLLRLSYTSSTIGPNKYCMHINLCSSRASCCTPSTFPSLPTAQFPFQAQNNAQLFAFIEKGCWNFNWIALVNKKCEACKR